MGAQQQSSELVKQESPKYGLNNIPKPFKAEADENLKEVIQEEEVVQPMPVEPRISQALIEPKAELKIVETSKPQPIIEEVPGAEPVQKPQEKTPKQYSQIPVPLP